MAIRSSHIASVGFQSGFCLDHFRTFTCSFRDMLQVIVYFKINLPSRYSFADSCRFTSKIIFAAFILPFRSIPTLWCCRQHAFPAGMASWGWCAVQRFAEHSLMPKCSDSVPWDHRTSFHLTLEFSTTCLVNFSDLICFRQQWLSVCLSHKAQNPGVSFMLSLSHLTYWSL